MSLFVLRLIYTFSLAVRFPLFSSIKTHSSKWLLKCVFGHAKRQQKRTRNRTCKRTFTHQAMQNFEVKSSHAEAGTIKLFKALTFAVS
jgi:hypothetical protein